MNYHFKKQITTMKLIYYSPQTTCYEVRMCSCLAISNIPGQASAEDMEIFEEIDW